MSLTLAYDVTGSNLSHAPAGAQLALYVTGSGGVQASRAQLQAHPDAVLIDQTPASGEWDATADVDDYEKGAVRLDELAGRAKQRLTAFKTGVRAGQRMPSVYFSASNIHDVVNALVHGGVSSNVGLFVANWNLSEAQAAVDINTASGPFPIIGMQFKNAGLFDIDLFSTAWLNNRVGSGSIPAPPGQWKNPNEWTWKTAMVSGLGLDGKTHDFALNLTRKRWDRIS